MLRYDRQTKPGSDIRPGNGAGLFLRPRSPHEACGQTSVLVVMKSSLQPMTTGSSDSVKDFQKSVL